MVNKLDVFNLVKIKAGLGDTPDPKRDPVIECAVDEAEELILNYIHRNEMPSAAKMVFVAVAADIYRYNIKDFELEDKFAEEDPGGGSGAANDYLANVSEIRIDDAIVKDEITAAKYNRDAAATAAQAKQEVDFLKNYKERLQRFRLMQWRKWEEGM
jgi:hypothetical protein